MAATNTTALDPHAARRSLATCMPDPAWWGGRPQGEALNGCASGRAYTALCGAFRASGGLVCSEDLARLLADYHLGEEHPPLADWLHSGALFALPWQQRLWLPMFQVDLTDLRCRYDARQVRLELPAELDAWQVAAWFARPNGWLNDARPVDQLARNLPAVLNAARADRFV
ncbi:MAG: hypothetical protein KA335_06300, partial [Ramlibacter sp.]|nr:hypothetical protein [Ramlibacter sp.]